MNKEEKVFGTPQCCPHCGSWGEFFSAHGVIYNPKGTYQRKLSDIMLLDWVNLPEWIEDAIASYIMRGEHVVEEYMASCKACGWHGDIKNWDQKEERV